MNLPRPLRRAACRSPMGRHALREARFRAVLGAGGALAVDLAYAVYHGMLGAARLSLWMVTLCVYYTVLGVMRLSAVLCARKGGGQQDTEYFVMALCGGLLVLFSLVLAGANYLSLSRRIAVRYGEITMITIAAYTFAKLGLVAARFVRRQAPPLLAVLRQINLAEAASVLTLQRSMLVSFGGMGAAETYTMNALTGAAVSVLVLALGVRMVINGIRKGGGTDGKIQAGQSE